MGREEAGGEPKQRRLEITRDRSIEGVVVWWFGFVVFCRREKKKKN